MIPSTWNDTNQHWIPQFLLKGFGIRRNASSVYELDKETKAIVVRKVSDVASKPLLVTEQDDAHLKKIEDTAAKAMVILRKRADIDEMPSGDVMDGFYALHELAEAMESINPYIGVTSQGSRTTVVDAFVATVKGAAEQEGETLDEQEFRKYIDDIFDHEVLPVNGIYRGLLMWMPHVHNAPDGEYFVIGDSPVVTIRSADGTPMQRILPISSRRIVTFTYNIPGGRAKILGESSARTVSSTLTGHEVNSLNAHYFYRTRSQYIYGRDKSILRQSAVQPLEWAVPASTDIDYDAGMMLKLLGTSTSSILQVLNPDIREKIRALPVSKFVSRARQIRMRRNEE